MLKILHLTNSSEAGGLSRYLLDLCPALQQRGIEVSVAGSRGAWHEKFATASFRWIDLPLAPAAPAGFPLGSPVRELRKLLEENPVDLLHTHYRRATWAARRASRGMNIPILYTLHLSGIPLSGWRKWFSDFGDHAHSPSKDGKHWLIETAKFPAEKITVIPHGIDSRKFPERNQAEKNAARAALGLSDSALVAVFAARLDFPKNPEWMLDVAEASQSSLPNLHILIAGTGPQFTALQDDIARRKLFARVTLLGEREMLPIYQAADALLLPSLREGFGLVCGEAMSVGVPVLRTCTSGTEEMIIEGVTGRSVPIDRAAFVSAAVEFLKDQEALEKMGRLAAEHIRTNFRIERQIEDTIGLYRKLCAK